MDIEKEKAKLQTQYNKAIAEYGKHNQLAKDALRKARAIGRTINKLEVVSPNQKR